LISGETRLVGLLGDPVAQSLSPLMQNAAFAARGLDWAYVPLRVTGEGLEDAVRGLVALDFAVGVGLGALRLWSGSVTAPALAHVGADLAGWWLR